AKRASASSTVSDKQSRIDNPRHFTASTFSVKRRPPHASHGTVTSARKCISSVTVPCPRHVSQRPPATLNEKAPAASSSPRPSSVRAKRGRSSSIAFKYVAGFERDERPIGD